ncbi:MAG: hypothetical protein WAT20_00820 [Ferruginibacter sp.]|nr:hypothetical protein [Chitinophagaceae bacterium]
MKYLTLFIYSILSLSNIQGQKIKLTLKPPGPNTYSKAELAQEKKNHNCIHKNRISFSKISKQYPYNQTSQIQLVSFTDRYLPMLNDSVDYSKLSEVKTLNLKQIDTLTDILYNVGFGGTILLIEEMNCYSPRNAILFLNASGKQFAFLELCFECEDFRSSSENIKFGDKCNQKFPMLKKLFKNAGIVHGIED